MSRTMAEFMENFNGAPYPVEEIADLVSEIEDNRMLVVVATKFMAAQKEFEEALSAVGFVFG